MPYAIIRAGGHQEKVEPGEQITVDHLKHEVGDEVEFTPLAISKEEGKLISDKENLTSAKVVGKVVQHFRGEKVESFQYRHKTGYRRHVGSRQALTLVEIASITVGGETFTYTPPPPPEPGTEDAEKPAAEKKPAKKSAPKKPAAKKPAAAAKKSAPKKSAKKK
jgi:large subunit ribosomal protein L21